MKKAFLITGIILVAATAIGLFVVLSRDGETNNQTNISAVPNEEGVYTVLYTDSGFELNKIKVRPGKKVEFVNNSSISMWVQAKKGKFDSSQGIGPGESYMVELGEEGQYKYHNYLAPADTGLVIVAK